MELCLFSFPSFFASPTPTSPPLVAGNAVFLFASPTPPLVAGNVVFVVDGTTSVFFFGLIWPTLSLLAVFGFAVAVCGDDVG